MEVLRPIKTNWRTQAFGEDKACIDSQGKVTTRVSAVCPPNTQSLYKSLGMVGHSGEDWSTYHKEPLFFSVLAPTAWYAKHEVDKHGGIGVDIISTRPFLNGKYVKFRFHHLQGTVLYDGQRVKQGQLLGFCNNTGLSSGDHLHWSMKIVNERGRTLNKNNGYYGAVDFSIYFKNEFILNELGISDARVRNMYRIYLRVVDKWLKIFRKK